MALDLTPEQKAIGKANFQRAVGQLAENSVTRRQFMKGLIAGSTALPLTAAAYYGYTHNFRERPVKAGLIGAGDEGGVLVGEHNPAFLEFVAYSDIRPSNFDRIFRGEPTGPRKGFNYHYGSDANKRIRRYERYRDLLNDPEIEMVVIALPLNLHYQATLDALQAGKHVLCEKLMAWDIGQCKHMIQAAERDPQNPKLLAVGHQRHYSMLYAHASGIVESGILGDIRHIRALWHRNNVKPQLDGNRQRTETIGDRTINVYRDSWRKPVPDVDRAALENRISDFGFASVEQLVRWRLFRETGGGLMAELGSHQLDACSIFLDRIRGEHATPLAVSAVGGKHFYQDEREVEDHVYCSYEFPGKNYDRNVPARDDHGNAVANDIVTVTYSSINTNDYEAYGECVMGDQGTLIVEKEQEAYLGGPGGRSTSVSVGSAGGRPVMDTSATTADTGERRAVALGQESMGHAPPSRGYREEMEHFAFILRNRDQGMERDRESLKPRCDGRKALGDAVMALTANIAMRDRVRIEFKSEWFDPASERTPEGDHPFRRS